jgi:regulation of enolase protein 1 (concanavalin A-like superfamily)
VLSGCGNDIWNNADSFRFAYKKLNGNGSIVARVDTQVNTNAWAKAGVMIRETLDAGSKHAMMVVTPGSGASFQHRDVMDGASANTDSSFTPNETAPLWVKLTRTGNTFKAECSADGVAWRAMDTANAATSSFDVTMVASVYIGLCVTSHDVARISMAEFSNVAVTGTVTGQWQAAPIGPDAEWGNSPDKLYVAIEDSTGKVGVATNADAVNYTAWTEWKIPLSSFAPANLAKVKKMYIGVGDRNNPVADGAGRIYIDDIRVMKEVIPINIP